MRYKAQVLIFSLTLAMLAYGLKYFPILVPDNAIEFSAELAMLIACIAIMIYVEQLKTFRKVYLIMLAGASLSYFGCFLDVAEELFNEQAFKLSNLEDSIQTLGFIVLCLGIVHWLAVHRELIAELRGHANTDQLTGLLNRRAFYKRMARNSEQRISTNKAYLLLDIDHFKAINDSYGHNFGDTVLVAVAQKLNSKIRESDILSRWGGEEFLLYLDNCEQTRATEIAQMLKSAIAQLHFDYQGQQVSCTVSIGVYNTSCNKRLAENISCADKALYKAKQNGRNTVVVYSNEISDFKERTINAAL